MSGINLPFVSVTGKFLIIHFPSISIEWFLHVSIFLIYHSSTRCSSVPLHEFWTLSWDSCRNHNLWNLQLSCEMKIDVVCIVVTCSEVSIPRVFQDILNRAIWMHRRMMADCNLTYWDFALMIQLCSFFLLNVCLVLGKDLRDSKYHGTTEHCHAKIFLPVRFLDRVCVGRIFWDEKWFFLHFYLN